MEVAPVDVVAAVAARHAELAALIDELEEADLRAPSSLPGWDRLTILCHLRYGAEAGLRITDGALRGEPVAFYPEGRSVERPWSLLPRPGEAPFDVVRECRRAATAVDEAWAALGPTDWDVIAVEPDDNPDLGPIALAVLALLRLTEVEVHGTDLAIGASEWSDPFVSAALPMRLKWLSTRRSNHAVADQAVRGSWVFRPDEGEAHLVRADAGGVSVVHLADEGDADEGDADEGDADEGDAADVEIGGKSDALLGFLLGRVPLAELRVDGDAGTAAAFLRAFPPP